MMVNASHCLSGRARLLLLFAVATLLPACAAGGGGASGPANAPRVAFDPAHVIATGEVLGTKLAELPRNRDRLRKFAADGAGIGYQSGKGWLHLGDRHHQLRLAETEARPPDLLGARIVVNHFEQGESWQAHAKRFGLEPGELVGLIDGTANSFRNENGWLGVYATQHDKWFVCVGNGRHGSAPARPMVNELLRVDSPDGWNDRNLTVGGFVSWHQASEHARTAIASQDGRRALAAMRRFREHMRPKVAELMALAQACADEQEARLRVPRAAIRKRTDVLDLARQELRQALADGHSHRAAAWARMGQRHEPRALLWWQIGEIRARMANQEPLSIVRLCSEALNSGPDEQDRIELLRLRASANAKLGQVHDAIGDTATLLRQRPNDGDAQRLLHSLTAQQLQTSIHAKRRQEFEQRVAANPSDCLAQIGLAMAVLQVGDEPTALRAFAKAGELDAKQMTPAQWLHYADLLGSRGQYSDGFDALQRASRAHPEASGMFAPLSDLLLKHQRADNPTLTEEPAEDPEARQPKDAPRRTVAQWQEVIEGFCAQATKIGTLADELAETQKQLEQPFEDPTNRTDWSDLATRWHEHAIGMRKNEAAREALAATGTQHGEWLEQQREDVASNEDALHKLSSQLDDARNELYQRSHADKFEASSRRAEAWAESVASLAMLDKPEQVAMDKWLAVEPPPPLAVAAKGLQLYAERDLAQAAVLLHGSLAIQPDHQLATRVHEALRSMRNVAHPMLDATASMRASGDCQRAVSVADQAVLLAPHEATGYANRARAHASLGAWDRALADLSQAVALAPLDQGLRHERSRAALRMRRFDLYLLDADTLLAQQPGADSHDHRSKARELVLDLQGAWQDHTRAMRLRGQRPASKRIYRTSWENDLAQSCLSRWRQPAARAKCTAPAIWAELPWQPGESCKDLVANRLLELVQGDAPANEWQKPLAEADDELARTWQGLSTFLLAEWWWVTERREQARPLYRAVCDDAEVVARLAVLAAHRLRSSFAHQNGTRERAAILVPQDYATLDEAMRVATIGQTIYLADGRYRSSLRCNKSLYIVGHGPSHTTIEHTGKNGEVAGRLQPTLTMRNLRLEGGPANALDATGKGNAAQCSLAVLSSSLLCDNVSFGPRFCIWATSGSTVELVRCIAEQPSTTPLVTARARATAWLDRCLLDRSVIAREAGSAFALGVHLNAHAQIVAIGRQSQAHLTHCFLTHHASPALVAREHGQLLAEHTIVRGAFGNEPAAPITGVATNGKVTLKDSVVLGRTAGLAPEMVGTALAMANETAPGEPVLVATIKELRAALANRQPHIQLAKGTYHVLGALAVDHQVVLAAVEAGVVLRGRVDRNDTLIETGDAARLEVHGVRFEFATDRPHPTIAKAFELLRKPYKLYRCIAGEGRVSCIDCDFAMPTTVDERDRYAALDCTGGAMLLDRCTGKGRLLARSGAQAWLVSAPVSDISVGDGATVHTTGTRELRRIEIQQGSHLELLDCSANGIGFVTISDDVATAVRSAQERLLDGIAPAQLSQQLWAAAHGQHIAPLTAGAKTAKDHSVWEWIHAIDGYRDALSTALRLIESDSDKRAQKVAKELLPLFRGHPERLYNFGWKSYGPEDHRTLALLRDQVPKQDRDWILARATASWELGMKATKEQVDDYQPWIAARLKGEFTKTQVRDARANGYSIPQYRLHLARLEAERQRKEAEVRAASASGDRNRLRAALLAFGGNRYGQFLLKDSRTSDSEIDQGIALASDLSVVRRLQQLKRTRQAAASARAAASRYDGNSGHSAYRTGGSSYQPRRSNDFQQWLNRSQRWNRSMDRWISNFKSSQYNSYQNRY